MSAAIWGSSGGTWATGSFHWVGTNPFVGVEFNGSDATVIFSGSSRIDADHNSVRYRVSNVSMPSDASIISAPYINLSGHNGSFTTSSFVDSNTIYVKAMFYSGSSGGGAGPDIYSTQLTKSGNNSNSHVPIWRPVKALYAWNGVQWGKFYEIQYDVTIIGMLVYDDSFGCDASGAVKIVLTFDGDWDADGIVNTFECSFDSGSSWQLFYPLETPISTTKVQYDADLSGMFGFSSLTTTWFRVSSTKSGNAINGSPRTAFGGPYAC